MIKSIKNIKIISTWKLNYEMKETPKDLIDMLIRQRDAIPCVDSKTEQTIGHVDPQSNFIIDIKNRCIHGDIVVYDGGYNWKWTNAEVKLNKDKTINKLCSVTYERTINNDND